MTAATDDLTEQLADQPLALVEDNAIDGTLALTMRADAVPARLRERLEATRLARDPLQANDAHSLHRLIRETRAPAEEQERRTEAWKHLAPAQRRTIQASLVRRGIAETGRARGPVRPPAAHPDVLFALDLSTEPAHTSPAAPPRTRRGNVTTRSEEDAARERLRATGGVPANPSP